MIVIVVDNDCDGRFDEGYQGAFEPCGRGACKSNGFYICQGGSPVHDCTPSDPSPENTSNGIDDDCDGSIDEGLLHRRLSVVMSLGTLARDEVH